ncbi:MAG: hypothetical protein PHX68_02935 [Alphaproteobacteria bacterium]|nr:hypothetical protein [Alphaproteobacteria bacterium]
MSEFLNPGKKAERLENEKSQQKMQRRKQDEQRQKAEEKRLADLEREKENKNKQAYEAAWIKWREDHCDSPEDRLRVEIKSYIEGVPVYFWEFEIQGKPGHERLEQKNKETTKKHYLNNEQLQQVFDESKADMTKVMLGFVGDSYNSSGYSNLGFVMKLFMDKGADPHIVYEKSRSDRDRSAFEATIWRHTPELALAMMDAPKFDIRKVQNEAGDIFCTIYDQARSYDEKYRKVIDGIAKRLIHLGLDIDPKMLRASGDKNNNCLEEAIKYAQKMYAEVQDEPRVKQQEQKRKWRAENTQKRYEKEKNPQRKEKANLLNALRKTGHKDYARKVYRSGKSTDTSR